MINEKYAKILAGYNYIIKVMFTIYFLYDKIKSENEMLKVKKTKYIKK